MAKLAACSAFKTLESLLAARTAEADGDSRTDCRPVVIWEQGALIKWPG